MDWTTPEDLRKQLQRLWDKGSWLSAHITGETLFPRPLRLRRPDSRAVAERFSEVRDWVRQLQAGSRDERGFGYVIEWRRTNHRVHGANDLPAGVTIPTADDGLRLIGRRRDAQRFCALADETLARYPALQDWLARRPLTLLGHADDWPRVLAVLEYFVANPRPGIYLRQLDIPGVDTKFIGYRRKLFAELLEGVLPEHTIDTSASGVHGFDRRYGLRPKPPLIRARLLDPGLYLHGLSDISVPPEEFAAWSPPVQRVFITENEVNGLAFPDCPDSLVIFGLGYGLERLAAVEWLQHTRVYYWGDIDSHGFAILNRVRHHLPHARSLLMDHATLEAHEPLWGTEAAGESFLGDLSLLTPAEQAVFQALQSHRPGERVRLEQERIGYNWVRAAVRAVLHDVSTGD
ncbi:DUF3322 domain-containing protein [Aquisalimonas sp.]|uniref:DUF3322 domain-containing protein n=1 Tax=Aquisalimonas sp. TaxID=1872621 RepID=UPI0025C1AAF8|nr:DUF3322 domain-containing protein [Aquisalimonas sp.]